MPTDTEISVQDAADYIIVRLTEARASLTVLKLHKLLYYVQAWHLAFFGKPIFSSGFEAWVHGPVNRSVYDRFAAEKSMYSRITKRDLRPTFSIDQIATSKRRHIDAVLEVYADFSDTQLEEMTHREKPWKKAREGYESNERCQVLMSNEIMRTYYGARLGDRRPE